MPLTTKEANQLNTAKAQVKALWNLACDEANVPRDSQFVVFDNNSPAAQNYNEAMTDFLRLRNRIKKNMARRELHATYTHLGLKRVKGALGGVYYE